MAVIDAPRSERDVDRGSDGLAAGPGLSGHCPSDDGAPETTAPRPFRARELFPVGVIGVVAPIVLFRMIPFGRPVVYAQDAFQHLAIARSANWLGVPGTTEQLNAPFGLDWATSVPTGTERLHVLLLKLLWTLTGGDPHLTLNLTVVVGVAVTMVVSYCVVRWLGVGPLLATAAAVAFSFSSPLTDRLAAGHLFLFPLFPVALGVYLAILGSRPWTGRGWRALVYPAIAVVVVATTSVYYATFTLILAAALGVMSAVRAGRWRALVAPAVIVAALACAMAATLAPDLARRTHSTTSGGFTRPVQDSDRYGMRLAQMVLPVPSTRLPVIDGISERAYWIQSVGDFGVSIGPLAVAGLIAMGWSALRRVGRGRDKADGTVTRLASLTAIAVIFATAGGGGLVLAAAGFTQTRVWSRMAAFIGFAALTGLVVLIQRGFGRRPRLWLWVAAVLALALVEHPLTPPSEPIAAAVREDAGLVHSLESSLPSGASVLSLPVVPFPDDLGSQRLLAPTLLSDDLRFSAGAFKGGTGDWQQSWFTGEMGADVVTAAIAGFDAVLVQRSHQLIDDPDAATAALGAAAGEPVWTSDDGNWAWVDVRPLRRRLEREHGQTTVDEMQSLITRPIGVTIGDRRLLAWSSDQVVQRLGPDASIDLHRLDGDSGSVELSFDLGAADGAMVEITAPGIEPVRVRPGRDGERVTIDLPRLDAVASVRLRSNGLETRFDGSTPASVWVGEIRARDGRAVEQSSLWW